MTHIVITGSEGFVGSVLVNRLLTQGFAGQPVKRLTLLDTKFAAAPHDARIKQLAGSIAEKSLRQQAFKDHVDAVFHLASIPGGAAERDYDLGRVVNLDATLGLLEDLREQAQPPRFVFASTIAVYGEALPALVTENTLAAPALSYGAQKLIGEILVADASRRGWVQGCSLRLPGVVARAGDGAGLISAFMSQLFWKLRDGKPITLPVSADGAAWWISVGACVDNLIHAATLNPAGLPPQRVVQMPVLHLTMADVINALALRFGADRTDLVSYQPDKFVQANFASYPPITTPRALSLGFTHDGDANGLVQRAIQEEGKK